MMRMFVTLCWQTHILSVQEGKCWVFLCLPLTFVAQQQRDKEGNFFFKLKKTKNKTLKAEIYQKLLIGLAREEIRKSLYCKVDQV